MRLRSAFSIVSCSITTTTSSRIEVRARVGPRPVYSCTTPTIALEIAELSPPALRWSLAMSFPLPNPSTVAAREAEGIHQDPTGVRPSLTLRAATRIRVT